MSEKRFYITDTGLGLDTISDEMYSFGDEEDFCRLFDKLNEQQEYIEELQVSDEMGWKRAEKFEKKCPKELHNKKMYIKRLEYKVQKFKEMNGEQQSTINKLRKILAEAEDMIESRLAEHYLKEYENIKHNIIGDNDD